MSTELRQKHTRYLRQEYVVIEEAARVLRDIIEALPDRRVNTLFCLSAAAEEPAIEDLRSAARAGILGELLEFLDSKLNPEPRPRPRLVRSGERIAPLQLTYRQFEAALREWDAYTFLEMKRMSRGIPSETSALRLLGDGYDPEAAETVALNLSDLAGFLWKSLEAGPGAADHVHDEYYAEEQARHFGELYQSPERVADTLRTEYGWLPPPEEMFLKLGQPAQLIVVRDGMLQRAVDNYGRGVGLKREREEAERRETKHLADERRKVNEAVRRMRELDKSQCVFCGKKLVSHLGYVRITGGAYEVLERSYGAPDSAKFNADDVVLSCKSCASKLGTPEGAGMAPAFGRFSVNDVMTV
jgi:hypothetical protein